MQQIDAQAFALLSDPSLGNSEAVGYHLIKFTADWCSSCKRLDPILDAINAEDERFDAYSIDADENPEIAEHYNVLSLPTLLLFRNGELVWEKSGALSKQQLQRELERAL